MNSDELRRALDDIEQKQHNADLATNQALRLVVGRLRKGSPFLLTKIKAELRDFNASAKTWK